MQRVQYKHGDTPLVQTTRVPGCLVLIVYGVGRIDQPIGHVRLSNLLNLGHSQRIVNSSDSFIHSSSNDRVYK